MKCNNCQSEWTSRVAGTIIKCPFCGYDLVDEEAPATKQQPSFADELRNKTRTKQQLAEEKEYRRKSQIQRNVQTVVQGVKYDCGIAAHQGLKKLNKTYSIFSYECRSGFGGEWELCHETSFLVKQALQKEGFWSVNTSLRRNITGRGYDLRVHVRW